MTPPSSGAGVGPPGRLDQPSAAHVQRVVRRPRVSTRGLRRSWPRCLGERRHRGRRVGRWGRLCTHTVHAPTHYFSDWPIRSIPLPQCRSSGLPGAGAHLITSLHVQRQLSDPEPVGPLAPPRRGRAVRDDRVGLEAVVAPHRGHRLAQPRLDRPPVLRERDGERVAEQRRGERGPRADGTPGVRAVFRNDGSRPPVPENPARNLRATLLRRLRPEAGTAARSPGSSARRAG